MNKTNKFILLGVAIILLVVVIVVGWDKKTAQAPETQTSPATQVSSSVSVSSSSSTNPISVVIQGGYFGKSFTFNFPNSWAVVSVSPFSIDNFGGNYKAGGAIPAGGAEIDIATTTTSGNVQSIMDTELMGAVNVTTSTITVDGVTCEKASSQANYGASSVSQDISIYCSLGNELWKIYFSYPANDPTASTHISDFNGILSSMKFVR